MAQPLCKRTRLAFSSELEALSGISEDMDVTPENTSVEFQGADAQGLEENGQQSNSDDSRDCFIDTEEFEQLLIRSAAFIDKTFFIKIFFEGSLNEKLDAKKILITAPSRFGKSVIMNTLKVFCEPDVDGQGNIVTCLKKNAAGKWVEDKNKTPPKNYELFKTVIRNKPLQIYSCTCRTKHVGDDLENGTCDSRQFFYLHCGQHPVIFLSLKNISTKNWNEFIETLKGCLCATYKRHSYLGDDEQSHLSEHMKAEFNLFCKGQKCKMERSKEIISELSEVDLKHSLKQLVKYLYIQFNKKVLILIDEFDAPLMKLVHQSESIELLYVEEIIQCIGRMLGMVLKGDERVLGALINACVFLSTSLLTYANNVSICPFLEIHAFCDYYGLTKAEVADLLKMRLFNGFNKDILSYYNGYTVFGTSPQLYNTFSVLKCLQDWKEARQREKCETNKSPDKNKHISRSYYFSNHGIDRLNELFAIEDVRRKINDVITYESVYVNNHGDRSIPEHVLRLKEVLLRTGEIDYEHANLFLQYMKDRGYFHIIEPNNSGHDYVIRSGEAKDEIMSHFYDTSYYKRKYNISNVMIGKYTSAMNGLDRHNSESFQKFADSIASLFSGALKPKNDYEIRDVLYIFCVNEFDISWERLCQQKGNYRCDLLLVRKDGTGIIIKVKFGQDSTRAGLKEIFDKEYYKGFEAKDITKDKIYIGVHMNDQIVTVCGFATSNEEVVEKFPDIPEAKLIVKSSKF